MSSILLSIAAVVGLAASIGRAVYVANRSDPFSDLRKVTRARIHSDRA